MLKKAIIFILSAIMIFTAVVCVQAQEDVYAQENTSAESVESPTEETVSFLLGSVSNILAEDEEALSAAYADKFEQMTYSDPDIGLSITYNLYLPKGYDASESYPMVVFIADSSCAGKDAQQSLTQGRGVLVWASAEWQSVYPTIVAVPTYPEVILDDHGSYTTTEYVELTKRFIDFMTNEYSVTGVYGTGQSMGCMTTLILASEYPGLYDAYMFVDGQWDISTLSGLEDQTFIYFAAEDDSNAWNSAQEVMAMFDADSVSYKYAQWDGTWSCDELSEAAKELFVSDENQYFISWLTGTIEPKESFGQPGNSEGSQNTDGESPTGESEGESAAQEAGNSEEGESSEAAGGMNSSAYHMASFDYAYNCVTVMEWLFQQIK